jgi:hypothetical protein
MERHQKLKRHIYNPLASDVKNLDIRDTINFWPLTIMEKRKKIIELFFNKNPSFIYVLVI